MAWFIYTDEGDRVTKITYTEPFDAVYRMTYQGSLK